MNYVRFYYKLLPTQYVQRSVGDFLAYRRDNYMPTACVSRTFYRNIVIDVRELVIVNLPLKRFIKLWQKYYQMIKWAKANYLRYVPHTEQFYKKLEYMSRNAN